MFVAGKADAAMRLLVDDFNSAKLTNVLGGNTGCWNCNPKDTEQYCVSVFSAQNALEGTGHALKLSYDISTSRTYVNEFPNIASNGYFTQLNNANLEDFKYLVMYIKGDKQEGFTKAVSLELKNLRQSSKYLLQGITDEWGRFIIPLSVFKDISDWSSMKELVFVFNETATRKSGAIYIDYIYFAAEPDQLKASAASLRKDQVLAIDGNLNDWESPKSISFDPLKKLESGEIDSPQDLNVTASFLWDYEYLYFSARVIDDQIFCRENGANIWQEDCVELYIDPGNKGLIWGNTAYFQIGFAPTGADGKPQSWAWFQGSDGGKNITTASVIGELDWDRGYQIEAAIRWDYLGVNPKKGGKIGVTVAIHDLDYNDNTQAKVNWCYIPKEDKILLGVLSLK